MSKQLEQTSPFFVTNVVFINELYQKFLQNPASVDASWAEFFTANQDEIKLISSDYQGPSWAARSLKIIDSQDFDISSNAAKEVTKKDTKITSPATSEEVLNLRVANLISSYKRFGHLAANLDPLGLTSPQNVPELDFKTHGITESDLAKHVEIAGAVGVEKLPLLQVIADLKLIHANKIGAELAIVDKRRPKAGISEVMNIIGDVEGKNCIIVDDMVDSGGTLCKAAEALLEKGASSVSAYITHGVLSEKAADRIEASKLKTLVITNSIQPSKKTLSIKNIHIINIADLLGEAIRNISQEKSVSTLFD